MRGALLAGLLLIPALAGLGASSLQGCDEAYYAQMARGMLDRGEWVVPRYDGTAPLDKPPLTLWLVAASFAAFGVGDLPARLPLVVLGFLLPLGLFAWSRWAGDAYAFTAASTLGTTLLYVQLQHAVMTDLVAFAGFVAFAAALLGARGDPRWGWLAGLGLGVATLAKGALAALLVLASLPFLLVYRASLLRWGFWVRCVPGLLPAAAWYAAMAVQFGRQFFDVHFGLFLFRLAAQGISPASPLGPLFYLASALWRFLPWWPLLPGALWWGYRQARRGDPVAVWALGFCVVYLAVITVMRTKMDHYALPLALPVALLIAGWTTAAEPPSRWDGVCAALYGTVGALAALAASLVAGGVVRAVHPGPTVATGLLVGFGFTAAAVLLGRGNRGRGWATILGCSVLAYAVAGTGLRPWDAEPGLRALAGRLPKGADVTYVAEAPPGVAFCAYSALRFRLDRPPRVLSPEGFRSGGPGWYVGREGVLRPTPHDFLVFRGSGWVLVRRPE